MLAFCRIRFSDSLLDEFLGFSATRLAAGERWHPLSYSSLQQARIICEFLMGHQTSKAPATEAAMRRAN